MRATIAKDEGEKGKDTKSLERKQPFTFNLQDLYRPNLDTQCNIVTQGQRTQIRRVFLRLRWTSKNETSDFMKNPD